MKTLIFMQAHIMLPAQGRLMATAVKLAQRLNPGVDILMVDNASPLEPLDFLAGSWLDAGACLTDTTWPCDLPGGNMLVRFPDAIGHFHYDQLKDPPPRDGPGRAIMTALKMASCSGYRRAVYMESDMLFRRPVEWGFKQMTAKCGNQAEIEPYGYRDMQVMWFADLPWLEAFGFVEKYDWPNRTGDHGNPPEPPGEKIYTNILGPHVEAIDMLGGRGDAIAGMAGEERITVANWARLFPHGCDYITHVDLPVFAHFLATNGFEDLVPGLMWKQPARA